MKNKAKRFFLYFFIGAGIAVLTPAVTLFFLKDTLIQQFIKQANKYIGTPVRTGKVDISVWEHFPKLGIVFHDVYIEDSHAPEAPLLTAESVSLYFNPMQLWQGEYTLSGADLKKGNIHIKVDKAGENNYVVLKNISKQDTSTIRFNLTNIRCIDTQLLYDDESRQQHYSLSSRDLQASITAAGQYEMVAEGDITTHWIGILEHRFLRNKPLQVTMALNYDGTTGNLYIKPSLIKLYNSEFEVQGKYTPKYIDIQCRGTHTTIQSLLSFLPQKWDTLHTYENDGEVYFNASLKGPVGPVRSPALSIDFGLKNATLFHKDYPARLTQVNLNGAFHTPAFNTLSGASLTLKGISGNLNKRSFQSEMDIQDLNDPYVKFSFQGNLDMRSIMAFYPIEGLNNPEGNIGIDIGLEGRISTLKKSHANIHNVITRGAITLDGLTLALDHLGEPIRELRGTLQFARNELIIKDLEGHLDNTDLKINGKIKNFFSFVFFQDAPIGVEAHIQSDFLDANRWFGMASGDATSPRPAMAIPALLRINLNYNVTALHYKRFKAANLTGNMLIKDQNALLRNVKFDAMGGSFLLNGAVAVNRHKALDLTGALQTRGTHIDSLFYVFENFSQNFVRDKHIKGKLFANLDLEMTLSDSLTLLPETLTANIGATIKEGELNNFEPLQGLKRYISDDKLNHLRFSDLNNDIVIKNKTIYIPHMEVKSNATTIDISGTHTFDQKIDYRLAIPILKKKRPDRDEAFGRIEKDSTGQPKLFLKITGTTDDYKISYDKKTVKKKIIAGIKKEINELKETFKQKGEKRKPAVEIEEEDYFDWNDSTQIRNE